VSDDPEIDVAAFRDHLIALREELEAIAETGAEAARPVELDQSKVGRLSRMDAIRSQAMSIETQRRRVAELGRIKAALVRIEEGEFGFCQTCGEAIAVQRLAIDPAAQLCIDCANKAEDRAKTH
jgi:DnaK suppressor protein